jgi:hypothetical protein
MESGILMLRDEMDGFDVNSKLDLSSEGNAEMSDDVVSSGLVETIEKTRIENNNTRETINKKKGTMIFLFFITIGKCSVF